MADRGLGALALRLRRDDHDRYLTLLTAPAERRGALAALYGFNHELARMRELVTEPAMGDLRLAWWRETLEAIFADPDPVRAPHHEVATPLARAIRDFPLGRGHFELMLEGRALDLSDEPFRTLEDLEAYLACTATPLVRLALEVILSDRRWDADLQGAAERAARGVALGYGLAGLLRAVAIHRAQGRLFLPLDLLEAAGLGPPQILDFDPRGRLAPVARPMAERARAHLAAARAEARALPRQAAPALNIALLADLILRRLARRGFDPMHPHMSLRPPTAPLRLAWRSRRGRW